MDDKPFFEFNLNDYDEKSVGELKKFAKANFDLNNILSNASELKYAKQIEKLLVQEPEEPNEEFVKLFTSRAYTGRFTATIQDQFRALVRNAFRQFLRDQINDRLKSALRGSESIHLDSTESRIGSGDQDKPDSTVDANDDEIITTQEETEGFYVVRAILSETVDPCRVIMRDTKSYCGVLLDDNNRKPICRLRFNSSQKYLGLFDAEKNEEKTPIASVQEISKHAKRILECVAGYTTKAGATDS